MRLKKLTLEAFEPFRNKIEIDFEKLEREIRFNATEKNLARLLLDFTELKIRYLELSVKTFEAKNKLFKDEMDRLFKNRILEIEDKKDIKKSFELISKSLDDEDIIYAIFDNAVGKGIYLEK